MRVMLPHFVDHEVEKGADSPIAAMSRALYLITSWPSSPACGLPRPYAEAMLDARQLDEVA